jgi:hypothetical protein
MLWKHPKTTVTEIAAGPGGKEVALVVTPFPPSPKPSAGSAYLYLLEPDGRVRTIDVIRRWGLFSVPAFLRSPADPKGPVRLYWVRNKDEEDLWRYPKRWKQLVMLDGDRLLRVDTVLLNDEFPFELHGYAGSSAFTLTVMRRRWTPTRYEVFLDRDGAYPTLTRLADFDAVTNTDLPVSVAWISTYEYVVAVVQRYFSERYTLRLFVTGCEYRGSQEVYTGSGVDLASMSEGSPLWPYLPGGRHSVLVLPRGSRVWTSVDVRTGRFRPTGVRYREGAWTFVTPAPHLGKTGIPQDDLHIDCDKYHWTYP